MSMQLFCLLGFLPSKHLCKKLLTKPIVQCEIYVFKKFFYFTSNQTPKRRKKVLAVTIVISFRIERACKEKKMKSLELKFRPKICCFLGTLYLQK